MRRGGSGSFIASCGREGSRLRRREPATGRRSQAPLAPERTAQPIAWDRFKRLSWRIHLLTPTQNLSFERPVDPITTQAFRDVISAELAADDETSDSLLVSLGSMRLIHAVVMRCVPAYKLRMFVEKRRWSDVREHIPSFDVEGQGLQTDSAWHFEVIVDPYSGDAYLRYMEQVAASLRDPASCSDEAPFEAKSVARRARNDPELVDFGALSRSDELCP